MARALVLLVLIGCTKGPPAPTRNSCEVTATRTCEDYESRAKTFTNSRRDECAQVRGTWRDAACPTAQLVGSCTEVTKKWTRIRRYYAGFVDTPLDRVVAECGAYGTWRPGEP